MSEANRAQVEALVRRAARRLREAERRTPGITRAIADELREDGAPSEGKDLEGLSPADALDEAERLLEQSDHLEGWSR